MPMLEVPSLRDLLGVRVSTLKAKAFHQFLEDLVALAFSDGASTWAVLRVTAAGTYTPASVCTLVVIAAPGANVTIRLPPKADSTGVIVKVKRKVAGSVTVQATPGDSLEAGMGSALDIDGTAGDYSCDGVEWLFG